MRVAISGSSGFVGTALRESLTADGHDVLRLVRRQPASPDEVWWDPRVGDIDPNPLEGLDAVVNLSGAGVGDRRWTKAYKDTLRSSRIHSTTILATTLSRLDTPPRVFLSASGMNVYGADRGDHLLDEDSGPGQDFLARLCHDWEHAAHPASAAGIDVCHARFTMVMDRRGGSLAKTLPLFRLGLGGTLAGGRQYWSFISLADTVRALRFLIETPGCSGPYNIAAPEPVTNAEFTRVLAHALHRPAVLPVPRFALRTAIGELSAYIAGSMRVVPTRLTGAGFKHEHPTARTVVAAALDPNVP
ncbi:TIGR01777 family oxidoreductase [Phytoactinopolyspora limicola]|uniref:TIGR01777 family oxidoreductase n=1 Tax=Phytoactinopolyspora limicola TaxID=2715536 RepID=UPI0014090645|nr:TIGR01777 family oxidoreductase [Phytoactinopolyspora limicola]